MAKKRMLSASVISTDAFMNLSLESQALYNVLHPSVRLWLRTDQVHCMDRT